MAHSLSAARSPNRGATFGNKGYRSLEDRLANAETPRKRSSNRFASLHCNHLGGVTWANSPNDLMFQVNASTVQKALGYRFVIKEL